jgi:hypothetical protein
MFSRVILIPSIRARIGMRLMTMVGLGSGVWGRSAGLVDRPLIYMGYLWGFCDTYREGLLGL